ncbi:MAG: hypothetical protein Q8K99_03065 [Actinomycetota bacterium]|nr:hypothetical protein [Actinomycetota bacterium]
MIRRVSSIVAALMLVLMLASAGCSRKMVTVSTGEIVLCTEGEIVSDTTEEIQVPEDEVGEHYVKTSVTTCDRHTKLPELYEKAQQAIRAKDFATALGLLAQVVEMDPTYRKAGQQAEDIKKTKTTSADGSPGTGPADGGDSGNGNTGGQDAGTGDEPVGPIMSLAGYMPDKLPGFVGQGLVADPFVLTRNYLPAKPGPMRFLVIVAEQFIDAKAAGAEMNGAIKRDYPEAGSAVTISGKSGYSGARDGTGIVAFVDGAVLVAVEGTSSSDDGPGLRATLTDIAKSLIK